MLQTCSQPQFASCLRENSDWIPPSSKSLQTKKKGAWICFLLELASNLYSDFLVISCLGKSLISNDIASLNTSNTSLYAPPLLLLLFYLLQFFLNCSGIYLSSHSLFWYLRLQSQVVSIAQTCPRTISFFSYVLYNRPF